MTELLGVFRGRRVGWHRILCYGNEQRVKMYNTFLGLLERGDVTKITYIEAVYETDEFLVVEKKKQRFTIRALDLADMLNLTPFSLHDFLTRNFTLELKIRKQWKISTRNELRLLQIWGATPKGNPWYLEAIGDDTYPEHAIELAFPGGHVCFGDNNGVTGLHQIPERYIDEVGLKPKTMKELYVFVAGLGIEQLALEQLEHVWPRETAA